ncbi:hypothetical protein SDC9_136621 [bioreactor metagenome]|uniref:Uncharacterized protein n=1 Tax=bioreactor metagenome TaxID=1076179 RepID=A0A645DLS8_9ZZZZ
MLLQRFDRLRTDRAHVDAILHVVFTHKISHQVGNIFNSFPQRWQYDLHHAQTIVKIFAEFVFFDQCGQITVGGRNHLNIHGDILFAPHPLEGLVFNGT